MLKFFYATKAEIPEAHANFYEERDGKFYLKVEGAVSADRLTEFRDRNTTLQGNLETIVAKVTNKDVSEVKGIKFEKAVEDVEAAITKARADAVKAGKGDLETIINERTQAMRDDHAKTLKAAQDEASTLKGELSNLKINQEVLKHATEAGLRTSAHTDILARAAPVFKLEDGKVVAYQDGKPMYNANSEPLSIQEWVVKQRDTAGHLFEASTGGGATPPGRAPGNHTGANPWDPKNANLTEQSRIFKSDPALAAKLAQQHGVKLPG